MQKLITVLKSPFSSGNSTPQTRSRANSIDLDSSFDMIGDEERVLLMTQRIRILEETLLDAGFVNDMTEHNNINKNIKNRLTSVVPKQS